MLCLAAVLLGAPTAADAAPSPPTWSAPALIDHQPPFSAAHVAAAISCPTTTLCVAVDNDGYAVTSHDPTSATPTWSVPRLIDPTSSPVTGVSCPSTTLCVATTINGYMIRSTNPAAETPTWSTPLMVDPVPDGTPPNWLTAISCPSTTLCVAVDGQSNAVISTNPAADDPVWTRSPARLTANFLASVSCASSALCVAVDEMGALAITTNPTAATPTWTAYANVDAARRFTGISCPSTTLCVAVDANGNAVTSTNPTAASPSWSVTSASTRGLRAVACPSTALCIGVGIGGNLTVSTNPAAAQWTQKGAIAGTRTLTAISCPTTSLCQALLSNTDGATHSTTPGGSSTSWSAATQIDGTNALRAVACPAETLCMAVDDAGHIARTLNPTSAAPVWELSDEPGYFVDLSCPSTALCVAARRDRVVLSTTSPGAQTVSWVRDVAVGTGTLVGVSCPTTTLCMVVNAKDETMVSTVMGKPQDPDDLTPRWSDPAPLPDTLPPAAISCPTTALCAVASSSGNVLTTTTAGATPTWTMTSAPLSFALTDIACPTAALCVAADYAGRAFVTTNPAGATPVWSGPRNDAGSIITCPTMTLCLGGLGPITTFSTDPVSSAAWTMQPTGLSTGLITGLSCASPDLCAAVTDRGHALLRVAAPTNLAPPTLSGTAAAGQTLTAADGRWTATPSSLAHQWERCDAGGGACAAIDGATGTAYAVTAADIGQALRVRETALNGGGSETATSAISGVVPVPPASVIITPDAAPDAAAAIPPATVSRADLLARLRRALTPKGTAARLRTLIRHRGFVTSFTAPSAGRLILRWYSRPKARRGHKKPKPLLLATVTKRVKRAGTVTPKVTLTRAGRRLLRTGKRVTVTGRGSFTATGAKAVTATKVLTLRAQAKPKKKAGARKAAPRDR